MRVSIFAGFVLGAATAVPAAARNDPAATQVPAGSSPAWALAVGATGHLGRSFERNSISFGARYTDWSLVAAVTRGPATLSTGNDDTSRAQFGYPAGGGTNRNIAKGGLFASLALGF